MERQLTRAVGNFLYTHRAAFKRLLWTREPVLVQLPEFKMYVRLDDWLIGARIFLRRRYEAYAAEVMRAYLKPGQTVLDLGANVGYYTLLAAMIVGKAGKVIAFEPLADNCDLIRKSLAVNHFTNVTLYPFAVADTQSTVGVTREESNGMIVRDTRAASERVRAVALDAFLDKPRVDVIKMDIEGAEGLALNGMRELVRANHPIVFTELHPQALLTVSRMSAEDYLDAWRALGYEIYVLDRVTGQDRAPSSNAEITARLAKNPYPHLDLLALPGDLSSDVPSRNTLETVI